MPGSSLTDPTDTRVSTLELNDNPGLPAQLQQKCASAARLGYHLAGCFPHLDRLVMVFQKPLPNDKVK
ncbi:MAG: hypothetical protein AAGC44_15705 [Planctomycetota bacterium]